MQSHCEREKEEYECNHEIRSQLSGNNYHLIAPETSYNGRIRQAIKESGAKKRKNSVLMISSIVTASHNWIVCLDERQQRHFFETALEYLEKTLGGEKNIISAVVHMDENAPHMHVAAVPITEDGRLCAKDFLSREGKGYGYIRIIGEFYEHMSREFPDLDRPAAGDVSRSGSIPAASYKRAQALISKEQDIISALGDTTVFNLGEKKLEISRICASLMTESAKVCTQIEQNNMYVGEISDENRTLEYTLSKTKDKLMAAERELSETTERLESAESENVRYRNMLRLIPADTRNAFLKGEKQFEGVMDVAPAEVRM